MTSLTNNTFLDSQPAWSPDGSKIAFASTRTDGNNRNICVTDTDPTANDATDLAGLTNPKPGEIDPADAEPAWSPDGNSIAYVSEPTDPNSSTERNIYVMNANVAGRRRQARRAWR